jgi:competence protein ComEC
MASTSDPLTLIWLGVSSLLVGLSMAYVLARAVAITAALRHHDHLPVRPTTPAGLAAPGLVLVACDVGQGDGLAIKPGTGAPSSSDSGPAPAAMRGLPGPA